MRIWDTLKERIEVTDAFRFTFQFGKRVGPATFRFGIKESTGGVGLDFHFFNRRLEIMNDVFDFQANVYPRWKILLGYEFFSHMYIVGGIDDAINDRPKDGTGGGRDFFFGGQLRFSDDDLKNLLIFGLGETAISSRA